MIDDFHSALELSSRIGAAIIPIIVLVMMLMLIRARHDLSAALRELRLNSAKVDVAVANIEIVRHATNSLMEESKRAAEILAYAAGVKAGLKQEDLVMKAAADAAALLKEAADRAALVVAETAAAKGIEPPASGLAITSKL